MIDIFVHVYSMSYVCNLQYVNTQTAKPLCNLELPVWLCTFWDYEKCFSLSALLYLELINLVYNFSRPSHNKVMRNLQQLWQWPQPKPKPKPKPKRNPSNLLQFLRAIMGVTTDLARQFMHCFAMCNLFFLTSWSLFIQT